MVGARSGGVPSSRHQSLALFIKFKLPGAKEASFCSRKLTKEGRAEFGESEVAAVNCSPALLDQWWTSSIHFSLHCRSLGQRAPLLLGAASLALKHLLASEASLGPGLQLDLPVYKAEGLARSLGLREEGLRDIVATVRVCLKFGVVEGGRKARPLSPRKAERETPREGEEEDGGEEQELQDTVPQDQESVQAKPVPVTLHSTPSSLPVCQPVLSLLRVSPSPGFPPSTLVHRTWSGREVRGRPALLAREVLLVPGQHAANRLALSRLLDNYLVVEVWREGEVVGLARLPTAPLHRALGGGEPRHLVVATEGLVEVVGLREGEVLGVLEVGLWAGTEKQLEGLGGGEGVERGTMTEEESCTQEYDTPDTDTELEGELSKEQELSKELETVREASPLPSVRPHSQNTSLCSELSPPPSRLVLEVTVAEARHLPPCPATYCSLPGGALSPVVQDSTRPEWGWRARCQVERELLSDPRRQLILKVWNCGGEDQDQERDQILGFAAVDLSPLVSMATLEGWYNLMDWLGKCRGQVYVGVQPVEPLVWRPVPRLEERSHSRGEPQRFSVAGQYSQYPAHLVQHTELRVHAAPSLPPPGLAPLPQYNFLPPDPSRSYLEGKLASNLADLETLSRYSGPWLHPAVLLTSHMQGLGGFAGRPPDLGAGHRYARTREEHRRVGRSGAL